MIHKELSNEIMMRLKRGDTLESIKDELRSCGWNEEDLGDAVNLCMFPKENKGFKKLIKTEVPFVPVFLAIAGSILIFTIILINYRHIVYEYNITLATPTGSIPTALEYGSNPSFSNKDYFIQVENQFSSAKTNFIEANLSTMDLKVWKNGEVVVDVPIKAKGRVGSWWETPAGLYKVETKEKTHFSGMGHVYMPFSMEFQGNFYLHGWPYYEGGTEVASTYSGGCIRLATDDSEKVYNAVDVGMPILVFNDNFTSDNKMYSLKRSYVSANEYLVADLKSDFVFFNKDEKNVVPIASVTKLITALLTTEYLNLDSEIVIKQSMISTTSKPRLYAGEKVSVYELLLPMLMESSNEAANAIAQTIGQDKFIGLMNSKAKSIGMKNTTFVDAYGGGDGNVSTTEDLFILLKYLYNNRSFILKLTMGDLSESFYTNNSFYNLSDFNKIDSTSADFILVGAKVGKTTAAKETRVSIFETKDILGDVRPIAVITLGSDDSGIDTLNLISDVKNLFQ